MKMSSRIKSEFARALRNFKYERTESGLFFPAQKARFGGVFSVSIDGGPWADSPNKVTLEYLDAMLSCYLNNGTPPAALYMAPFTGNTTPTSALTAATFASTQGEYTGYTETARRQWVPNGDSSGQSMSNSNSPAVFTIGAGAVTVAGAGLLSASAKSATTGVLVAAALLTPANTLGAGSTLSLKYTTGATPS